MKTTHIASAFLLLPLILNSACGDLSQETESAVAGWNNGGAVVRSASGHSPNDILEAVKQYRADLGGENNLAKAGTQAEGHREINWDGVPADKSSPNFFPGDFFKNRGALFSTPGNWLEVSAKLAENAQVEFANVNSVLPKLFQTFSPEKLFASVKSNTIDVTFTVPGTDTKATVSGFGAVFTDVDLKNISKIDYYDAHNKLLASVPVANIEHKNETLSFPGVNFKNGQRIAKVTITTGNVALCNYRGESSKNDLVALDDFIYAEPKAIQAPRGW